MSGRSGHKDENQTTPSSVMCFYGVGFGMAIQKATPAKIFYLTLNLNRLK
jgi:hypothetical protein